MKVVTIAFHPDAAEVVAAAASAAYPLETGGLLLGWWRASTVVVRHAVEVPDPRASSHSWSREEGSARAALAAAKELHEHPWLGYVGDWHSHPLPCPASPQDRRSIREVSQQLPGPAVLLVRRADDMNEVLVAADGRLQRPRLVTYTYEGDRS